MANFQKFAGDKTTRFDSAAGRLVVMLGERPKVDLWGGGPGGEELVVDFSDPLVASAQAVTSTGANWLRTYELKGLKTGSAVLEARLFNQTPNSPVARRKLWSQMPVWAKLEVAVRGNDYRQADPRWGNLKYGSTNPKLQNVDWGPMGDAGCGPTALATVMDYLLRLANPGSNVPASFSEPGVDPKEVMAYTSTYGRSAEVKLDPITNQSKLFAAGTSPDVMVVNLGKRWPGYVGKQVLGVDQAAAFARQGHPLLIRCKNCSTYTFDAKGNPITNNWKDGHILAVVGVEHDNKTFWLSDPSGSKHLFISREELKKALIWMIYKTPNICQ